MADQNKPNKDLILREKLALQRTVLANQTTFLVLEILFYAISATVLILGIFNYFKHKGFIHASEIHVGNYKDEYLQS